jgi:hypothetical protein
MAWLIYGLCTLTAILCAYLLLSAYARGRYRLLLWSGVCFVGLALNNAVLVVDKLIIADVDLSTPRALISLVAMSVLLYGLIWDVE